MPAAEGIQPPTSHVPLPYAEALAWLFRQLPCYQRSGKRALRPSLANIQVLLRRLGDPQWRYPVIHVAGTNGKGSVAHTLSAILMQAGYKVGLYTSPHLADFRERIRCNGATISQDAVSHFVHWLRTQRLFGQKNGISFFEASVAMALDYFAKQKVGIAVVEVGLGGRWDATNVFQRTLGVITSIDYDHTEVLGNTLSAIAREKAAIAKPFGDMVLAPMNSALLAVLRAEVAHYGAQVHIASGYSVRTLALKAKQRIVKVKHKHYEAELVLPIQASYYLKHLPVLLETLRCLQMRGYQISQESVQRGFRYGVAQTGLRGRWELLGESPRVLADGAHNEAAWRAVFRQAHKETKGTLWLIIGLSREKNRNGLWRTLPAEAKLILTQAHVERALPVSVLKQEAQAVGCAIAGTFSNVNKALAFARTQAHAMDCILITGSLYLIAELKEFQTQS